MQWYILSTKPLGHLSKYYIPGEIVIRVSAFSILAQGIIILCVGFLIIFEVKMKGKCLDKLKAFWFLKTFSVGGRIVKIFTAQ